MSKRSFLFSVLIVFLLMVTALIALCINEPEKQTPGWFENLADGYSSVVSERSADAGADERNEKNETAETGNQSDIIDDSELSEPDTDDYYDDSDQKDPDTDDLNEIYFPSLNENETSDPDNMTDGNYNTYWSTVFEADGEASYFVIDFNESRLVSGVSLYNGICDSEEEYFRNARIKEALMVFSGGEEYTLRFEDVFSPDGSHFSLREPRQSEFAAFMIKDIYPGKESNDIYISEVEIF